MVTAKEPLSQVEVPGEVPGDVKKVSVRKTRATRSAHPGVVLIRPDSRNPTWRARCEDPDKGKRVKVRLDPLSVGKNAQARRRWAIDRANTIRKRRDELASGAPRMLGTELEAAVGKFYEKNPQLRKRTTEIYKLATDKLLAWAKSSGIRSGDDLNGPKLMAFRDFLQLAPKRADAKGAKRGGKKETDKLRKPGSVNIELRAIKTVLKDLRKRGHLPRVTLENLTDSLKQLPTAKNVTEFLRPDDIARLLKACEKHDAETFALTREEKARGLTQGATLRYQPIRPIILVTLLTGMRFGEVADLDWSEVKLDAGEIKLGADRTKTNHGRVITFEHSPLLAKTLKARHSKKAEGRLWQSITEIKAGAKRLSKYGAPDDWTWQTLRRTCGTYLANAGGIFGGASAYRSAQMLGHSVAVAEKRYWSVVTVDKDATTLEAAMGIV